MYIITFSRKMGTPGTDVARRVASALQYNFYDTEAIENTAREMGFLKDVTAVDEKRPSLFQRLFSHRAEIYLDRLNSVIYELASRGNAVLLGRGSHILLRTFSCALHVRVTASLEKRIQNLMEKGFEREAAIKALRKSDHEREAFIKFAFGVDWDSPELYDIVLNMDHLSVGLAVDAVVHLAGSDEMQVRSYDAMKSLAMMGLARRAEAALIEAGFPSSLLSVSVTEPGKLQMSGVVQTESTRMQAEDALKGVKGIDSIENRVQVAVGALWSPD